MCPPERPRSSVSIPKIHALCAGIERRMRPCGATRAGTQAPPLPNSIIFFHTILHKQNNHLHAIHPKETNRPCAIRPYPSPPNRTVCPYPIGVILSIAQGWQVQHSLPWVMVRGRRLPPWGLYFFSSHIITTRGEQMVSCTQIDFKKYNADGIGSRPATLPRVASYRRQPWAIKSTTPMVLVLVHRFPNKQNHTRNPPKRNQLSTHNLPKRHQPSHVQSNQTKL